MKYFIRGIGAGLLIAILLYNTVIPRKIREMSDSEIISRASGLGMEMTNEVDLSAAMVTTVSDAASQQMLTAITVSSVKTADETSEQNTKAKTDAVKTTATSSATKDATVITSAANTTTVKPAVTENVTVKPTVSKTDKMETGTEKTKNKSGTVTVSITKGMSSRQFSESLYDNGVIDNAEDFDNYLIKNDYASFLVIGSYKLKSGMSFEEIAKKVSSK